MSHVQMPENRRKRPDRKTSGLYLPAWSIAAMLLIVIAIVVALVTLLITLGGGTPASGDPRVVIITAVPTETPVHPRSMTFDPDTMMRLFTMGYDFGRSGAPWRQTPPGVEPGEEELPRAGRSFEAR